jgi:hypothetical protein
MNGIPPSVIPGTGTVSASTVYIFVKSQFLCEGTGNFLFRISVCKYNIGRIVSTSRMVRFSHPPTFITRKYIVVDSLKSLIIRV